MTLSTMFPKLRNKPQQKQSNISLSFTIGNCVCYKQQKIKFFKKNYFFRKSALDFFAIADYCIAGVCGKVFCSPRQRSKPHMAKVRISIGSTLPIMTITASTTESKDTGGAGWRPYSDLKTNRSHRMFFRCFSRI